MSGGHTEQLVTMANDIAHYFVAQDDDVAAAASAVASHIKGAWDPRMRKKIIAHLHAGGAGLEEISRLAVAELTETAPDPLDGDR